MEICFELCDTLGMSEETLPVFIRRHRQRMRLTQQDLADALEMNNRSVSDWERGATIPGRDALTRLAGIFKISLDEFRRFIWLGDETEALSPDQVVRKEQAVRMIDELLADPQKLDEWISYGEYLREKDRRAGQ